MPPAKALATIVEGSGTQLDPALVQIFVDILGIFPAGSLLRLDTGEVAAVVTAGRDGEPITAVIALTSNGERIVSPDTIELDPSRIVELVMPDDVGLDPASLVDSSHVMTG